MVPPMSVSVIATKTSPNPFAAREHPATGSYASNFYGNKIQRVSPDASIQRQTSNQPYEYAQKVRRTHKIMRLTEMSKFGEESLSGIKIRLQSNPKQRD